jgi:hypothetical protein
LAAPVKPPVLLRRGADVGGFNFWVGQLNGGYMDRLTVLPPVHCALDRRCVPTGSPVPTGGDALAFHGTSAEMRRSTRAGQSR